MTTSSLVNGVDLDVLAQIGEAGRADRNATKFTLSINGKWNGGSKMTAATGAAIMGGAPDPDRAGRFTMVSDEPSPLGTDEGPNPVEYLLQALGACYTVGIAMIAAQKQIKLDSVRLELEADVDLAAFFGVDASVPPGVSQIRVNVFATSSTHSREQIQELVEAVEKASTLRDTLVRPVDVVTKLVD